MLRGTFLFAFVFPAVVLGTMLLAWRYLEIPPGFFSRDPTATLEGRAMTGALSNLGVLIWAAACFIALFSGWQLRSIRSVESRFLLAGGLLSGSLMLDDLFCIHESRLLDRLGVSEILVFGLYGIVLAGWLWFGRCLVRRSTWRILLAACVFFAISLAIDLQQDRWDSEWRIFFEDGAKFVGICCWTSYLVATASTLLGGSVAEGIKPPGRSGH